MYPDVLDYSRLRSGVALDLGAGTVQALGRDSVAAQEWRVLGTAYADSLVGGDLADQLYAGGGDDILSGGAGEDHLFADPEPTDRGEDVLSGGADLDLLVAAGGADVLSGDDGDDSLYDRGAAPDLLRGGEGHDSLEAAGRGPDQLHGEAGDDRMVDTLTAGTGQVLDGGSGLNTLRLETFFIANEERHHPAGVTDLRSGVTTVEWSDPASASIVNVLELVVPARWTVHGTDAAEQISGTHEGPLTAYAGGGDDLLTGTASADHLDGGEGLDTARPKNGDDTCVSIETTPLPGNACDPA